MCMESSVYYEIFPDTKYSRSFFGYDSAHPLPASTQPNRLYVHSATSHGATSNAALHLAAGYPQRTIFENLHEAGINFGIYFHNIPLTLFYRRLRKLKFLFKFHHYNSTFKKHAKSGKLPNYVVIEPRYFDTRQFRSNDDHPSHDVYRGQMLVKEVYETLRSSPQWNQTLFLITYDEHGGFYDHVPTPVRGVPSPDGIRSDENFNFDRLGVRVPTIAVSPWIEKGTIVHGPNGPTPTSEYEHSSIPATVKKIFNLPNFLNKRDEWAGTFEGILQTRTEPRTDCPMKLPTPVRNGKNEANEEANLSEFQQELIQLSAVLKGDNILTSYPHTIGKDMNVKQGKEYTEDSVRRFFEAGHFAKKMQVSEEHIVQMKPSLTSRPSKSLITNP
ncbi:putative phospholipase C [Lupinus albus]|uniref:Putative phospholipase C n=1 Tax=Lupinus albus TaxID=3870 RepID=A0A6A4QHT2_LUPAL|nr:putative phospholipase C [Lupinus albus]